MVNKVMIIPLTNTQLSEALIRGMIRLNKRIKLTTPITCLILLDGQIKYSFELIETTTIKGKLFGKLTLLKKLTEELTLRNFFIRVNGKYIPLQKRPLEPICAYLGDMVI